MAEPLKDRINADVVARLAEAVALADENAGPGPLLAAAKQLEPLELKERVNLIADALQEALTGRTVRKLASIQSIAANGEFDGLTGWPLASFIERHALDDPHAALAAMEQVTETVTCEFAMRPFLTEHLELTMEHVHRWTGSPSEHPRRLASEGTRPNLPWAPRVPALTADPSIGLGVLERLRHDPSEYVRRSVANHLNDIAKTRPALVIDTVTRWSEEPQTEAAMVSQALRTLVKKGDGDAMAVLGFTTSPQVQVDSFTVTPAELNLGESVELSAVVRSLASTDQRMVVDFVIHHLRANGSVSPKVFKWTTLNLPAGATVELKKKRRIATASTRRYHAGRHQVDLQLAGTAVASAAFDLPVGST